MPLLVAAVVPDMHLIPSVGGRIGGVSGNSRCAGSTGRGARTIMGEIRVTFWGALEMAVTAGIGSLFGTAV